MSDEIKTGDLITRKQLRDCDNGVNIPWLGVVVEVVDRPHPIRQQVHFICQRTGEKDWLWALELIKLNKPTEEKS